MKAWSITTFLLSMLCAFLGFSGLVPPDLEKVLRLFFLLFLLLTVIFLLACNTYRKDN